MNKHTGVSVMAAILVVICAAAARGDNFGLQSWTVAGGGMECGGGIFELSATIGQPGAGPRVAGGIYTLEGGFWPVTYACPGDVDCSGAVDFGDINPFVLALSNPSAYLQLYPNCPLENRDIDANGTLDFGDINPFVALLSAGGGPCN